MDEHPGVTQRVSRSSPLDSLRRSAPLALLTCVYAIVAALWSSTCIANARAWIDADFPATGLINLTRSCSTALFSLALLIVTLVRLQPVAREQRMRGRILPISVIVTMAVTGIGAPRELPLALSVVSCALVVIGMFFTMYSLRHLGRHFGVVSDVRGLVTTGPYSWVRHPLYAGEAITLAGVVISVASPLAVAAFFFGQALQAWRARTEEESLASVFPEYSAYAKRTPMLVPGLRWHRSPAPAPSSGD